MLGRFLVILTGAAVLGMSAHAQTATSPVPSFAPGQVWSLKSTPPTTAKVVIGRIEDWNNKVVVHVSIVDIPAPKTSPGSGRSTNIGHMPFERSALANSVDRLLATNATLEPNFESGYAQWKDAKGGIFTISVPQAIEAVFQVLERNAPKPD